MKISWENIENLEDCYITYLLYKESKTLSQIAKIRNISIAEVNEQLIKAKLEIKSNLRKTVDTINVIDKFLGLNKLDRVDFINNTSDIVSFKREVYKRTLIEKNAQDLMILIWAMGELKDDRFLKLLHPLTNHRHSDIRRISYSAIRKIQSKKSREILQKGLYDSNPQTRQYCAKALTVVGDQESLTILKRLKDRKTLEKDYVLRAYQEAITALEKIYK